MNPAKDTHRGCCLFGGDKQLYNLQVRVFLKDCS